MFRRASLPLLCIALLAPACGEDDNGGNLPDPLPEKPQILPDQQASQGFVISELTLLNATDEILVTFVNGGQQDLKINPPSISGGDAAHFSVGTIFPSNGVAQSNKSVAVPVNFTSPGRGVFEAVLTVTSNAENMSSFDVDVVGLGGDATLPDSGDLEIVETTLTAETAVDGGVGVIARFFNLGGLPLNIEQYVLNDASGMFQLAPNLANPGEACAENADCNAGLSCLLGTDVCEPVAIASGFGARMQINYIPTAAGSHSCTVDIVTDAGTGTVTVNGQTL